MAGRCSVCGRGKVKGKYTGRCNHCGARYVIHEDQSDLTVKLTRGATG